MDKNPKQFLDDDFTQIKNEFLDKNPNIILCSKPFLKSKFLDRLVNSNNFPVIFLDFDLMYSGYFVSGMIKKNDNLRIFQISRTHWEKDLKEVAKQISREKILVILDSLNGVYNMFDELESARVINTTIMLLSSVAKYTNSLIVVMGIGTKNDNGEWILSPSGRHLMDSKKSGIYYLSLTETGIILKSIKNSHENQRLFEIKK
ncbi:MAG: ELP5 family protein [Nitrosopumilus sp.]|nr:ELP5 family protein [Nitrosopumilus sp.]